MNVITKIFNATIDTVAVITAVSLPLVGIDLWVCAWYFLCVALGFLLRIGMEHNNDRLTTKSLLYQSICTIGWSFFAYLVWNYLFLPDKKGFEIYIFINSLFAAFAVGQFEEVFQMGVKSWLRIKLGKFLASEEKEEIK